MNPKVALVLEFHHSAIQGFRRRHDAHADPDSPLYVDLGPHVTLVKTTTLFHDELVPGSRHLLTLETSPVIADDIAFLPVHPDAQACPDMRGVLNRMHPPGKSRRFHCTLAWPSSPSEGQYEDLQRLLTLDGPTFTVRATLVKLVKHPSSSSWIRAS